MDDANFTQLLSDMQQDYAEAEVINRWMPPDGEYTTVLVEFKDGVSENRQTGGRYAWMRLTGRVVAEGQEDVNDKEYTVGYYRRTNIGRLKSDAAAVAGRPIPNVQEAYKVLKDAVGAIITVAVSRRKDNKTKREFVNTNITGVVSPPPTTQ
jgi:hypothetical protein